MISPQMNHSYRDEHCDMYNMQTHPYLTVSEWLRKVLEVLGMVLNASSRFFIGWGAGVIDLYNLMCSPRNSVGNFESIF